MNTTFRFIKAQTTSACYFTFSSSFGFEGNMEGEETQEMVNREACIEENNR